MVYNILMAARFILMIYWSCLFIKAALLDKDTHKTIVYGILFLVAK